MPDPIRSVDRSIAGMRLCRGHALIAPVLAAWFGCSDGAARDMPGAVDSGAADGTSVPTDLDPSLPPGANFDLTAWKLTLPGAGEVGEAELSNGYWANEWFYTDPATGGMVFSCPNAAGTTGGSRYPRSELREMLRAGDTSIRTTGVGKNNWVLSTASPASQAAAGAVDGTLSATLRVDRASRTGDPDKVGRVIIGQIHGASDEPCRLYYRKLPDNSRGAIYVAHEPTSGSEQWYELIGSRSNNAPDPADGIALGELFSYTIRATGDTLVVRISRAGKPDVVQTVDMSGSGFANDWLYFKAGVYNQNNTGDSDDFARATFFELAHNHP